MSCPDHARTTLALPLRLRVGCTSRVSAGREISDEQQVALRALAARPSVDEVLARARDRVTASGVCLGADAILAAREDRKSTRLNSSHMSISYAVFCLKKKN